LADSHTTAASCCPSSVPLTAAVTRASSCSANANVVARASTAPHALSAPPAHAVSHSCHHAVPPSARCVPRVPCDVAAPSACRLPTFGPTGPGYRDSATRCDPSQPAKAPRRRAATLVSAPAMPNPAMHNNSHTPRVRNGEPQPAVVMTPEPASAKRDLTSWWRQFSKRPAKKEDEKGTTSPWSLGVEGLLGPHRPQLVRPDMAEALASASATYPPTSVACIH
jgi:hypothetical protein